MILENRHIIAQILKKIQHKSNITLLKTTSQKQGSFITRVLSTASAAHCGALLLYVRTLHLVSTVPMCISLP